MTSNTRALRAASATGERDLRDPETRRRFIFGDGPANPRHRATLLGDFLFFGALLRR